MEDFRDRMNRLLGLDRESALAAQKQDDQAKLDEENRKRMKYEALKRLMQNTNPSQLQNVSDSFKGDK